MRFACSLAMVPPDQLVPLARAAEAAGWDAIAVPDSVFWAEDVSAGYPFTPDGSRFWAPETPFVDPFVSIPAMAAATERIFFATNVLKAVLRHPLLLAKTIGSIASMAEGRVGVGLGISWMPEEFEWLGLDKRTRGARLDETIEILRRTLQPGWADYEGTHHRFGRLMMSPAPRQPVPIYVGGHSEAAMRRATRLADGWVGAMLAPDEVRDVVGTLRRLLEEAGRAGDPFEISVTPMVMPTPEAFGEIADAGATEAVTMPWVFYGSGDSVDAKAEGIERFATEVIASLR